MSRAFLFPGQGAQFPGMLHELPDHRAVARTLDEVSEILQKNVLELDTADALRSTVSVQLALLTAGVAVASALSEEGAAPLAVAGLSAGAFPAAVAGGVLGLADAVSLVKQRAELMTALYSRGYGVAAIVGLNEVQVTELVGEAQAEKEQVYVSGINAPRQILISGSDKGMNQVLENARKSGARKVERLDVAVPSHCELLKPVADALEETMQGVCLQPPKAIYAGNVTGRALRNAPAIAGDLVQNIAHCTRWHDASTLLVELGCCLFLEMPPGHTLSKLSREAFSGVKSLAMSETPLPYALRLEC